MVNVVVPDWHLEWLQPSYNYDDYSDIIDTENRGAERQKARGFIQSC